MYFFNPRINPWKCIAIVNTRKLGSNFFPISTKPRRIHAHATKLEHNTGMPRLFLSEPVSDMGDPGLRQPIG